MGLRVEKRRDYLRSFSNNKRNKKNNTPDSEKIEFVDELEKKTSEVVIPNNYINRRLPFNPSRGNMVNINKKLCGNMNNIYTNGKDIKVLPRIEKTYENTDNEKLEKIIEKL